MEWFGIEKNILSKFTWIFLTWAFPFSILRKFSSGFWHYVLLTRRDWYDELADSWRQVGLMLVTSFNCGYILSFSNLMLVPLGWTWGIVCLFVVGIFTWQDFTSSMAKDLLDTEISWALFLVIMSRKVIRKYVPIYRSSHKYASSNFF